MRPSEARDGGPAKTPGAGRPRPSFPVDLGFREKAGQAIRAWEGMDLHGRRSLLLKAVHALQLLRNPDMRTPLQEWIRDSANRRLALRAAILCAGEECGHAGDALLRKIRWAVHPNDPDTDMWMPPDGEIERALACRDGSGGLRRSGSEAFAQAAAEMHARGPSGDRMERRRQGPGPVHGPRAQRPGRLDAQEPRRRGPAHPDHARRGPRAAAAAADPEAGRARAPAAMDGRTSAPARRAVLAAGLDCILGFAWVAGGGSLAALAIHGLSGWAEWTLGRFGGAALLAQLAAVSVPVLLLQIWIWRRVDLARRLCPPPAEGRGSGPRGQEGGGVQDASAALSATAKDEEGASA